MIERKAFRESHPAAIGSAGALAVLTGIAVPLWPIPAIALVAAALVLAAATALASRARGLVRTPLEASLIAVIPLSMVAPWLTTTWPELAVTRYLLAAAIVVSMVLEVRSRPIRLEFIHIVLVAIAAYLAASILWAPNVSYGLLRSANWLMFFPLAFVPYDVRLLRCIFVGVVATVVLLLAGLGLQLLDVLPGTWGGIVIAGFQDDPSSIVRVRRYTSFLLNPNDLAIAALCAGAIMVTVLPQVRSRLRRLFLSALSGVSVLAVLITASRGALIAIPIAAVYMALAGNRKVAILGSSGAVLAVAITAIWMPELGGMANPIESLSAIVAGEDVSSQARLATWSSRLSHLDNWLVGTGFGGYGDIASVDWASLEERTAVYTGLTVDNGWLKLFIEHGAIGVSALVIVTVGALYKSLEASQDGMMRAGSLAAALVVVIVAWRGVSADVFDINPWNAVYWIAIGVASRDVRSPRPSEVG